MSQQPDSGIVQELLAEQRRLKVEIERLRLELGDAQAASGAGPRTTEVEMAKLQTGLVAARRECQMLREELAVVRAERDRLHRDEEAMRSGIERALGRLGRK